MDLSLLCPCVSLELVQCFRGSSSLEVVDSVAPLPLAQPPHQGLCSCSPAGKRAPQCYPSSVNSARTVMLFNLGSAYCLRSEYDKARKCLHQAASMIHPKEVPPEAILLAVYLELQNGNAQLALQIIRRNQLLPAVKTFSEMRRKPVFQPVHPSQPLQMPAFTVQRK